jgi:hypothetical protein
MSVPSMHLYHAVFNMKSCYLLTNVLEIFITLTASSAAGPHAGSQVSKAKQHKQDCIQ